MNIQQLRKIIKETLQQMIDNKAPTYTTIFGICYNLNTELEWAGLSYGKAEYFSYQFVADCALGWKHHSGERMYPVPPYTNPFDQIGLWEGEQLKLRISLCKHLLTKVDSYVR